MVSDAIVFFASFIVSLVLILVLMEDGLWRKTTKVDSDKQIVLILVLMEDGLWLSVGFVMADGCIKS